MKKIIIFGFLFFISLFLSCQNDTQSTKSDKKPPKNDYKKTSLQIIRITPSGEDVPAGRQIVLQFNRAVVPIGRMDRKSEEIPIQITPEVKCQWRWLNTTALACQLDDKNTLSKATKYKLIISPGIKAEDDVTIGGVHRHEFITERPMVRYPRVHNWKSPGIPIVRITFNQSVSISSVKKHLFFESGNDKQKKRFEISAEKDPNDRELPRYFLVPGESYVLDFGNTQKSKVDDEPKKIDGEQARRIWLVYPKKELPLDANINLKVEPGLVSAFGKETGAEDRVVVNFDTFPQFKFIGISCSNNSGSSILATDQNLEDVDKCNPLGGAALAFSSPVVNSQVKENIEFNPDLAGGRKDYDPWANKGDYSGLRSAHKKDRVYKVWFPEILKAAEKYHIRSKPPKLEFLDNLKSLFTSIRASELKDEFGRTLTDPIDINFYTDHRPPNFNLIHKTAVIEKDVDSDLPIYVTNLGKVNIRYRNLTKEGTKRDLIKTLAVPQVEDKQFAIPLELRDMLGGNTGAVYGRVDTEPVVSKYYREHLFFAQVSPYQLQIKAGHFNTLVWVTDLKTGKQVEGAVVSIYKDAISKLSSENKILDRVITDENGTAVLKGLKDIDPELDTFNWKCSDDDCKRIFVRVDNKEDMALMPLINRFKVNTYRVSNYTVGSYSKKQYGHIRTWGTTAQGVYRVGDTIQYKFYVRNQDNKMFVPAPKGKYLLKIIDPKGKPVHEVKDLMLSEFGGYNGEYKIPKNGAVGWYQFSLSSDFTKYTWQPLQVLVSDFTPSAFKVKNSLNGDLFHPGDEVEVLTQTLLHSGGAYTDAEARITAKLKSKVFTSDDPLASGFRFDSYKKYVSKKIFQKIDMIGDKGELSLKFKIPDEDIVFGSLSVESSVRDDRGKYIASHTKADYIAVDRLIGLKNTKWIYDEDKPARINYIVVDKNGKLSPGTKVDIKIERLETKAAKIKGAGNAYVTHYIDKWIPSGSCKGVSERQPLVCEFVPGDPGTYKFTASIVDTKGKKHSTQLTSWVAGKGQVVWRQPSDNSLQIIPEKNTYNIGETARYLIKNPYPGAKALITIERYGVIKHWVQQLEGSTPVIEFVVEKDFMPGFYLSVAVVSPRVESAPPEFGQIDLGKPAFKIGYVKVPVKDSYKQIEISIKTDEQIYKPRGKVKAVIHAEPKNKDKVEPIEIAVAVLDEAVLDLIQSGKDYFDPYEGFYKLDSLDLINYSLLSRLVGRQKFEKKGANPGGDGGASISMRSIFKFVSYWNPSIKPDENGNAEIEFELPDNLTGWRILAFALTPSDRMGLGDTNIKVNRPTEIRVVMPNQVTEGDTFKAGFSIMNRTDRERSIKVTINAKGNLKSKASFETLVNLKPYKRTTVYMPVETSRVDQSRDILKGTINFRVTAKDKIDGDGIEHTLSVNKRRSFETAANYGTTINDKVTESVLFPKDIYPDSGDISVTLAPSVIGNVQGAFRYIRDYPYICWEQMLTKGVMASHFKNLKSYMPSDFMWAESEFLTKEILQQAANYQAPNGGMVYFIPADRYVSPYLSAYTALAFNWLRESGYEIPGDVESKLHEYLKNLLKKDVLPTFYSRGMSSTVRAVALAALASHGKVTINDLQRYLSHVKHMSLFGKTHFLQAAIEIKGSEDIIDQVFKTILSHSSQSGGKFSFNEELDDSY
ncbi:MAG: large extracellular alpha-helical protein, partial [Deltaproteobacteria bacterium]